MSKLCVLHHNISALRVVTQPDGTRVIGSLTQLPQNTEVEICGAGFDDRTVTVRTGSVLFYAFRADLSDKDESGVLARNHR